MKYENAELMNLQENDKSILTLQHMQYAIQNTKDLTLIKHIISKQLVLTFKPSTKREAKCFAVTTCHID